MESIQGETTNPPIAIGAQLANVIEETLGQRLNYPDGWGEIDLLRENVAILRELTLNPDVLESTWDDQTLAVLKQATKDRLANHERKLSSGSIMISNADGSHDWTPVGQRASEARVTLKRCTNDLMQRSDEDYPAWGFDDTCQETAKNTLVGSIEERLNALNELIPAPKQPRKQKLGQKIGRVLLHRASPQAAAYADTILEDVGKSEDRRISRMAQKLNKELEEFLDAPDAWMCQAVIEHYREIIEQVAADAVDELVAERNTALLLEKPAPKPTVDSIRSHRPPKVRTPKHQRSKPIIQNKPTSRAVSKPQPTSRPRKDAAPEDIEIDVTAATVKLLGDFQLSVPWISEGAPEPTLVERVELNNDTAYIARCFTPQLEEISDEVRANSPAKLGELNTYDITGQYVAKRLAYGIVPRQSTQTIKRLDTYGPTEDYGPLPIWYTFSAKPNAPRVYFVVKKMHELTSQYGNGHETVDPNAHVMVIIAETDKVNQTDVVKTITSKSHRHTRDKGAGSI